MKITIDVPDILPANFMRPSLELLRFIKELQDACVYLARTYRRADGQGLFTAFVRNGAATVFSTADGTTHPIRYLDERDDLDDEDSGSEEFSEIEYAGGTDGVAAPPGEMQIVMDRDEPGNWVVARLCIKDWPSCFITLRSSDFCERKGKRPNVEGLMERIAAHLAKLAHAVPRPRR